MAVSDFGSDVDSGGPSLPSGVHSVMAYFEDIDSVSQLRECAGFGDPGLPGSSGKIPPESENPMSDVDSESGGPSLPSGAHSDMADLVDIDSVSQVLDYVIFG